MAEAGMNVKMTTNQRLLDGRVPEREGWMQFIRCREYITVFAFTTTMLASLLQTFIIVNSGNHFCLRQWQYMVYYSSK